MGCSAESRAPRRWRALFGVEAVVRLLVERHAYADGKFFANFFSERAEEFSGESQAVVPVVAVFVAAVVDIGLTRRSPIKCPYATTARKLPSNPAALTRSAAER